MAKIKEAIERMGTTTSAPGGDLATGDQTSYVASTIEIPKPSGWECELFGMGRSLVAMPPVGHVPNWFWRWTQYMVFGNRWKKFK